jgi:hypothetical protein
MVNRKIVVFVLMVAGFALLGLVARHITIPMGFGDSKNYLEMAQAPGTFISSPWGYRIGVPYAARGVSQMLSLPIQTAFSLLQLSMFGVIMTVLFLWVSSVLERGGLIGALCAMLFAFSYPGTYNLHNVVHVGLGEHLFVLLGSMAIYSNRFFVLCVVIAISCFVKESGGFLLIPTYLVSALIFSPWRTALQRCALLCVAFLAPFLVLRSGVFFDNHNSLNTYISFYTLDYMRFCWNYWGGPLGAIKQIAFWFGPLCLLSVVGFFAAPPKLKALAALPILATIQIALATDVMRMVGVGVPVMIALSGFTLSRMRATHAVLVVVLCSLHFLTLNHQVVGSISLIFVYVGTLFLLWMNRSRLRYASLSGTIAVGPKDLLTYQTK